MSTPRRGVERWLDLLLRAYPAKFREEHGREIRDSFLRRFRRTSDRHGRDHTPGSSGAAGLPEPSWTSRATSGLRQAGVLLDAARSALWHGLAARLRPGGPRLSARPPFSRSGSSIRSRSPSRSQSPSRSRWPGWGTGGLGQDLRLAFRKLRGAPSFTAVVVAVVALAVGAATAIFAVHRGSVVAPFSFEEPERVVFVWGSNPAVGQLRDVISGSNAVDFQRQAGSFEALAVVDSGELVVLEDGRARLIPGISTTPELFDVLGVELALGRPFTPAEATSGGEPAVILSHSTWVDRYGADPGILGRRIPTTDEPRTVVGVLPADFSFPVQADVVLPLDTDVISLDERTHYHYVLVGRLRPGVTPAQAGAELDGILDRIARQDPRMARWDVLVEPFVDTVVAAVRPVLEGLLAAMGLLLLIAGANVASLLLARAGDRGPENVLRRALGGSRWAIVRPALAETWLLVLAGAAAGWLLAMGLAAALPGWLPQSVPIPGSAQRVQGLGVALDGRALLFCLAVTAALGALASLPAVAAGFGGLTGGALSGRLGLGSDALSSNALSSGGGRTATGSRGRRRLHDTLVVAELALAVVLLVGATLAATTLYRLATVDPGLRPGGVSTFYAGALDDVPAPERALYFRRVLERVREVPGVVTASLNDYVPFRNEDDFEGLDVEGRPPAAPGQGIREEWRRVSTGYFETVGIDLVAGRTFEEGDFEGGPPVAVVNRAFARKHFGSVSPVGQRMLVHEEAVGSAEIVGVVGDVHRRGLSEPAPPVFYVPYHRATRPVMGVFARTEGEPTALLPALQEAVWSVDPTQPVDGVASLAALVEASIGVPRLALGVTGALAGLSLLVACLGVFGLIGHVVRNRRREMGIRLALGASPGGVQAMMVRYGLLLATIGVALGLAVARLLAPVLGSLLAGDPSFGSLALLAPAAVMLVAALLAAWLPASRLRRLDPSRTLRAD